MNREEAINVIKGARQYLTVGNPIWNVKKVDEAMNMAIEALQAEPNKAVPPSLADVYKWERDIALSQLEEYGIGFAEKKRDDLVEIVRCKDCKHHEKFCFDDSKLLCWVHDIDIVVSPTDYCSYAERRAESEVKE